MGENKKKIYYKKVGYAATEIFKPKYPNICKVSVLEVWGDVMLNVNVLNSKNNGDLLNEIDLFLRNYFNIRTSDRYMVVVDKCV